MSDENSANIDPRFDPAFQRGFEGAVTTTRRRPTIGTPPVLPAQATAARPVISAPSAPEPAAPQQESVLEETEVEADEPIRGVNPFVIVLWVVAVLLVIAGAYLTMWARTTFLTDSLSTNIDYVTIQIITYGSPLLVVLGLATGIGLMFLHAIAWKKRS
jgi:hypothetical protein